MSTRLSFGNNGEANAIISNIWKYYFTKDRYYKDDPRLISIERLYQAFDKNRIEILKGIDDNCRILHIDARFLLTIVPFADFGHTIRRQPGDVMG